MDENFTHPDADKRQIISSAYTALGLVLIMWLIKAAELLGGFSLYYLGIQPLTLRGLPGIIFSPLLHGDLSHLYANSVPMLVLGAMLFYFYRRDALKLLALLWLLTGITTWLFARGSSFHIGASGLIYAMAAFHFVSGVIKKSPRLMAFSLLVIFLYGGMFWGMFPDFVKKENISWESHLMGGISGTVIALYFKNTGPKPKQYNWNDDDDENGLPEEIWNDPELQKDQPVSP